MRLINVHRPITFHWYAETLTHCGRILSGLHYTMVKIVQKGLLLTSIKRSIFHFLLTGFLWNNLTSFGPFLTTVDHHNSWETLHFVQGCFMAIEKAFTTCLHQEMMLQDKIPLSYSFSKTLLNFLTLRNGSISKSSFMWRSLVPRERT